MSDSRKRRPMPNDQTCRISHGGCGRKVEIVKGVGEVKLFGYESRQRIKYTAVHEGDSGERASVDYRRFYKLRMPLEIRCARERGENPDA